MAGRNGILFNHWWFNHWWLTDSKIAEYLLNINIIYKLLIEA